MCLNLAAARLSADWPSGKALTTRVRLRISRMSVDYAILERARTQAVEVAEDQRTLGPIAAGRFDPFFEVLESSGLTRLQEWRPVDVQDYRQSLAEALGQLLRLACFAQPEDSREFASRENSPQLPREHACHSKQLS